jgi:hypothetical protein
VLWWDVLTEARERPIVWAPIPGSSQELALDSRAEHTLYCGTRGPGKSDTQLMRFRRRVGLGYGAAWRGIIFDREYKHLDDLITKSKKWFTRFNDGAEWLASTSSLKWVWPTGEELLFRVIKKREDYNNYHGHEYPFIGWNELTKYPSPELYNMMMSCNRSSFTEKDWPIDSVTHKPVSIPPIPLEVFSTCNSWGPGHGWVKAKFIDVAPYGTIVYNTTRVFNPQSQQEEDVVRSQVTIFGSYKENIYLSKQYIAGLMEGTETDENLRAAWLDGNWDIIAGGAFDDVWKRNIHVVPRFQVPANWRIDRSFDWGSSHPFSVGWWAEANGEEVELMNGEKFCPVPGSLIQCGEWYGTKVIDTNKGLKMSAGDVALGIKEREAQMLCDEWILKQPYSGPADNQIRDVREADEETIEFKMAARGVRWTNSDKSAGSRRNGLDLARERMRAAVKHEGPAFYIMDHCRSSIHILPTLPRNEPPGDVDDVDTDAEDHVWDMTRYRILKGAIKAATKLPIGWVN